MPVSAGGWGSLGRLGRGVCPPGLGLRGAVLANVPPPASVAPNFVLHPGLTPSGDRGSLGVGDASGAVSTLIRRKREQ